MQIILTQKYPAVIDKTVQPAEIHIISSIEDIFHIPFIKRWAIEDTFFRLVKCTLQPSSLLIAETNNGKEHWVLAEMEGDIDQLTLPEWKSSS